MLFSAATPGQGGEHHINEQPCAYWQALFAEHNYTAIDCLRPLLGQWPDIPHWYRYNLLLYVEPGALHRLPAFARRFAVPAGQPVADVSPLSYRLRKAIVRTLPAPLCNALAQWNARRAAMRMAH